MRATWIACLAAAAAVVTTSLAARPARACGGCFHPPVERETTVVTDHRMAFAVSPQQTVLWDQIKYSGSPQDFAWVLPVMPGAQIQVSQDEFFAALDAATVPTITGPSQSCPPPSGGCAFIGGGSSSASGAAFAAGASGSGSGGVQVISQSTIGPYDTVTVRSTNPTALYDWLTANGYDIPASTRPVIDAYVTGGFDFIALRLAPGAGVQAMQPVRVTTPGAGLVLPLRMVSAGVGANVGITLFVLGQGRYESQSAPNAEVDDRQLVWLTAQSRSNFTELSTQLMAGSGGRTWLTESALVPGAALPDAYDSACRSAGAFGGALPGDAGAPCDPTHDDLALVEQMTGNGLWVTRMRALLPAETLTEGDLVLQASAAQTQRSNQYQAELADDPLANACGSGGGGNGCAVASEHRAGPWLLGAGCLALAGSAVVRRRRWGKRS